MRWRRLSRGQRPQPSGLQPAVRAAPHAVAPDPTDGRTALPSAPRPARPGPDRTAASPEMLSPNLTLPVFLFVVCLHLLGYSASEAGASISLVPATVPGTGNQR